EAAACGTPALASDSPGLRESVRHAETGFLVPHGDARALADRMLALAADPTLVARLGSAARRFAEQFSWERAARATAAHPPLDLAVAKVRRQLDKDPTRRRAAPRRRALEREPR